MRKLTERQCALAEILVVAVLLCRPVIAQTGSSGSGTTSWGNYSWQVTQTTATTIVVDATFNTPPGNAYVPPAAPQQPILLPAATTVHEVHGNITLAVPGSGNGSILAQLKDQANTCIAAVKMQQTGSGVATLPISGSFPTPLSVSRIYVEFFVDEAAVQIVYMSLTMD